MDTRPEKYKELIQKEGGLIVPHTFKIKTDQFGADGNYIRKEFYNYGLTKREYFAALAMQGFISCSSYSFSKDYAAKKAVEYADALLTELENSK